jgi:hypothetical protein
LLLAQDFFINNAPPHAAGELVMYRPATGIARSASHLASAPNGYRARAGSKLERTQRSAAVQTL